MKRLCLFLSFILVSIYVTASVDWRNFTCGYSITGIANQGNNVWASTFGGLVKIDRSTGTSTFYNSGNSNLRENQLNTLAIDRAGIVWVANSEYGVSAFDGSNWTYYDTLPGGHILGHVSAIRVDRSNRIWVYFRGQVINQLGISSSDAGLAFFDHTNWTVYGTSIIQNSNCLRSFALDTVGNAWMATSCGVMKFDGSNITVYTDTNSTINSQGSYAIAVDQNNVVWTSNYDYTFPQNNRVYSFANGVWTEFSDPISLVAANARGIVVDSQNNKYFYCPNGLYKFNDTTWTQLSVSAYSDTLISALSVDSLGHIWSGFYANSNQLIREDDGVTHTTYNASQDSVYDYNGVSVDVDTMGNVWLLTSNKLYQYDGTTFYDRSPSHPTFILSKVVVDRDQNIWVCSSDNSAGSQDLMMFDRTSWTYFPYQQVTGMDFDSLGNLWFFSSPNLIRYDGVNFTTYDISPYTSTPNAFDVTIDTKQRVWVAGYDKILVYDIQSGAWTTFDNSNSPINPPSYGIQVSADNSGMVWIPASGGVFRTDGVSWTFYQNGWFSHGGVYTIIRDKRHQLWFATGYALQKFNGSGFEEYTFRNTGMGLINVRDVAIDRFGNLFLAGNSGPLSEWMASAIDSGIAEFKNRILGQVYYDSNANGVNDSAEIKLSSQHIMLLPDSTSMFTAPDGYYEYYVDTLDYIVQFTHPPHWLLSSDSSSYHVHVQAPEMCCYDFGVVPNDTLRTMNLDIMSGRLRCNRNDVITLTAKNTGTRDVDALLYFIPAPTTSFQHSFPTHSYTNIDTVFWNLGILHPFEQRQVFVTLYVPMNNQILLHFSAGVQDAVTGIIYRQAQDSDSVRCSYDPNDKVVQPEGVDSAHFTLMSDTLQYTIRFQNSGNDTAFRVIVVDTLSPLLNINTLEFVSSSHPCVFTYQQNGAVQITFPNIQLPYESVDENGSQGYVRFRIVPKTGLTDYTVVNNSAYIGFDFNPWVQTNTTYNTLVYAIPLGVESPAASNAPVIHPNPFHSYSTLTFSNIGHANHELTIYDLTGKVRGQWRGNDSRFLIEGEVFQAGVYVWKLENLASHTAQFGKLIVQ